MGKDSREAALIKEYGEIANNFRGLTDIRFKLLGLLPTVTAAAQAWKAEDLSAHRLVLSVFGLAVTVGLYLYNARNDQFYDLLISRAAEVERTLGVPDGSFANRPQSWLSIRLGDVPIKVGHRPAIGLIYAASAGLWLFGIFASSLDLARRAYLWIPHVPYLKMDPVPFVNLVAAVLAIVLTVRIANSVKTQCESEERKMKGRAKEAVKAAEYLKPRPALRDERFLALCKELSGYDKKAIEGRADFYSELDEDSLAHYLPVGSDRLVAAYLIGLLTDLPPQRIFDWITERRDDRECDDKTNV